MYNSSKGKEIFNGRCEEDKLEEEIASSDATSLITKECSLELEQTYMNQLRQTYVLGLVVIYY